MRARMMAKDGDKYTRETRGRGTNGREVHNYMCARDSERDERTIQSEIE